MQDEDEDTSPHIVYLEMAESHHFNIRCEKRVACSNSTFTKAVVAFFHLMFVANMRYQEEGESVAI
jgi:hypothetical protein